MVVDCANFTSEFAANMMINTGSMADVPKDLLQEIKKLEQYFTIETPKLKEITEHFVLELEKGKRDAYQ